MRFNAECLEYTSDRQKTRRWWLSTDRHATFSRRQNTNKGEMTMIVEARMISKTGRNVHFSKPPQYSPWERTCLLVGGALSQYPAISAQTLHCLRVSRPVLDRFSRFLPRPESTRGLALRRPTLRSSFVPTLGRRQNTSTGQRWRYRGSMRLIDGSIYRS